jgi:hypothetical protein
MPMGPAKKFYGGKKKSKGKKKGKGKGYASTL